MKEQVQQRSRPREVSPIRKEVVQKLSTQIARRAYEIVEEDGRKVGR